jgi:hypothetical protein
MRDIARVLADIIQIPGLRPGLNRALDAYREDIAFTAPERARPLWDAIYHNVLVPHLGIPPKGEPERRAWACWVDRPVDLVPAPVGEARP